MLYAGKDIQAQADWATLRFIEAGQDKTPAVELTFYPHPGQRAADAENGRAIDLQGKEGFTWRGWLTEKAAKRTLQNLLTAGWHGRCELEDLARNPMACTEGKTVYLTVSAQPNNKGKLYQQVDWINETKGSFGENMDGSRLKGISRELKGIMLELQAENKGMVFPAAAKAQSDVPSANRDDEDIPF